MNSTKVDRVYIRSFTFNQNSSCFIAVTTAGFRVYTCSPLSEFCRREYEDQGQPLFNNIKIAKMLYRSSCFAVVTEDDPQKVQMWDDRKKEVVSVIWCRRPVLNVLLSRDIICVIAETAVYIYGAGAVTPLTIIVTGPNPTGLCALSEGSPIWHLVCPATTQGAVRVQTAVLLDANVGLLITAHRSRLSHLAVSSNGEFLATASEMGTLIRLFRLHDGTKVQEFRLGAIPHMVHSISFRGDMRFLIASSNTRTIHIFKIRASFRDIKEPPNANAEQKPCSQQTSFSSITYENWSPESNSVSNTVLHSLRKNSSARWIEATLRNVLPTYFESNRNFAQFHLPNFASNGDLDVRAPLASDKATPNNTRSNAPEFSGPLCAFSGWNSNHFYVLHHDGFLYEARFDPNNGNDCILMSTNPWFAPRQEFQLKATSNAVCPLTDVCVKFLKEKDSNEQADPSGTGELDSPLSIDNLWLLCP